jgi:uncharacterized membrane protein YGL010W
MSNKLIVNGNFFQEGLRALGTDMSRILHRPLFTLGTIAVSPAFIFESLIFFAALTLVSGSAEKVLRTRVLVRTALDVEHRYRLARLFSLTVFVIGLIVGVATAGVDLRSLALLGTLLGSKLIPTLQAEGFDVIASQHGLDSHAEDVANVKRTIGRVSQPVILVGHSYGGSVITAAGTDDRVAGLVYLAAFAPDQDETTQSLQEKFPPTDIFSHVDIGDGRVWLKLDGVSAFAGDLSEKEQKLIWATQSAPVADLFNQKVAGTAWKSKPSWYVIATEDHTIQPDLERFVAKRMGATTFEVASSHVPMLSQPEFVLDVIRKAATSILNETKAA